MKLFITNKNESPRMFKNPVLEYFSHIHPAVPLVVYLPVILYFAYFGLVTTPVYLAVALWFGGLLFWTLLEYTMHRFAFHFKPTTKRGKRILFMAHGCHHDYPRDKTRLVMPLLQSVPLAFFFYFLFRYLFAPYHDSLYSGLVAGYLSYDCLHYAFHHFAMKSKIAAFLKVYHLKHHYSTPDSGYGVSNPLWDYVFRTTPKEVTQKEIQEWADLTAA